MKRDKVKRLSLFDRLIGKRLPASKAKRPVNIEVRDRKREKRRARIASRKIQPSAVLISALPGHSYKRVSIETNREGWEKRSCIGLVHDRDNCLRCGRDGR